MKKLDGKVALITGSGRGIGRAVALKLASEGARIVVNDLDAEPAAEVVARIKASGGDAIACIGSVTAPDFGERIVKVALESFGIDIIVSNAGYTHDGVIQKMGDEQFLEMLDVHLVAPFRICALPPSPYVPPPSAKPPKAAKSSARWCSFLPSPAPTAMPARSTIRPPRPA